MDKKITTHHDENLEIFPLKAELNTWVLPEVMVGIMEQSTTRSPSRPCLANSAPLLLKFEGCPWDHENVNMTFFTIKKHAKPETSEFSKRFNSGQCHVFRCFHIYNVPWSDLIKPSNTFSWSSTTAAVSLLGPILQVPTSLHRKNQKETANNLNHFTGCFANSTSLTPPSFEQDGKWFQPLVVHDGCLFLLEHPPKQSIHSD